MDVRDSLPVTHNARGLGGTQTGSGTPLAPVLFRSDALAELTEAGVRGLGELGIGSVIDLRTDAERRRSPNAVPADAGIELLALPVLGGAMDEMVKSLLPGDDGAALQPETIAAIGDQLPSLEDLYIGILTSGQQQLVTVARTVIEAATTDAPGVLVHCTAGKDRTGVATALLLSVAGVPREGIVADYTLTEQNLAGAFAEKLTELVTAFGVPLSPTLETLATKSPARAITAALDWLDETHDGAVGYLRAGGLSDDETRNLRQALLATP